MSAQAPDLRDPWSPRLLQPRWALCHLVVTSQSHRHMCPGPQNTRSLTFSRCQLVTPTAASLSLVLQARDPHVVQKRTWSTPARALSSCLSGPTWHRVCRLPYGRRPPAQVIPTLQSHTETRHSLHRWAQTVQETVSWWPGQWLPPSPSSFA